MPAGGSAGTHALRAREHAVELLRRYKEAYRLAGRYEAAAEAERRVAANLLTLTAAGWRLLVDRRWPGTRSANVDMILVGPGGVFIIDVKRWRQPPTLVGGHLMAGERCWDGEVDKLLAMTRVAERCLSSLGMSPIALRPVMVFAGHRSDAALGRVRLLGDRETAPAMVAEPTRLTPAMVRAVTAHLEESFPAYETPLLSAEPTSVSGDEPAEGLFDVEKMEAARLASLLSAPIERWMTFLHPDQVAMTRRNWSGPARISGPAGTGKTVVALHRAAYLAERTTGRILYVTYVNNLPRVQGELFRRMAPATASRVEFTSLHAWAQSFLGERGVDLRLSGERSETAFALAWLRSGKDSELMSVDPNPAYWKEEIDHVIKGRGVTSLEEYRLLARHGRRTALQPSHREAAWLLYEEYELLLAERGTHDFNDVLIMALEELRRAPADPAYAAVIVDEAQDLTLVGVQLLHALVGDAPNGLLLVGDGQQAVYPGGYRLSDAGIPIKGRGGVLRTNYRNGSQILAVALEMISGDSFDDLDGSRLSGRRDLDVACHEGEVVRAHGADRGDHDRMLISALKALTDDSASLADAAVLCSTRRQIEHYHRLLGRAGVPVLRLESYDGRAVDAVKLGTYRRAKGLEFKYVYLPCHDETGRCAGDDSEANHERAELARRQLFVAMTRARDLLWLGSVEPRTGEPEHVH